MISVCVVDLFLAVFLLMTSLVLLVTSSERTAKARDVKPSRPLSVRLTGEWVDTSEDEDRVRLREV